MDELSKLGLLYIRTIEGVTQQTRDVPKGVDFADLRGRLSGACMADNQLTLELCETELEGGKADLFSFGRSYIADPDLVYRLAEDGPLAEAPKATWYGVASHGCSDGPGMKGPVEVRRPLQRPGDAAPGHGALVEDGTVQLRPRAGLGRHALDDRHHGEAADAATSKRP